MPTLSRSVTKPSTKKTSAPTSRAEVHVAGTEHALCHSTPSAVSRDRRPLKPSDRPAEQQQQQQKQKPKQQQKQMQMQQQMQQMQLSAATPGPSRAAAQSAPAGSLASHSRPLSEPLSADDARSEVEVVGDASDDEEVLDDLIRDPVTLEVRRARSRSANGRAATRKPGERPGERATRKPGERSSALP